jgi:flavin reductase (DIM6/NTAB) family NADH-FMN oxidoreductase RutF
MDKKLQQALEKMTHGIYVITTCDDNNINGMIASWVTQVSYEPPMVMVAIHPSRFSHHLIEKSGHFVLHILAKEQINLLSRFKGSDPSAKFHSIKWTRGKTGCPILETCIAYLECRVKANYNPGNHSLFIGEIIDALVFSNVMPLSTFDYHGVYTGKD